MIPTLLQPSISFIQTAFGGYRDRVPGFGRASHGI